MEKERKGRVGVVERDKQGGWGVDLIYFFGFFVFFFFGRSRERDTLLEMLGGGGAIRCREGRQRDRGFPFLFCKAEGGGEESTRKIKPLSFFLLSPSLAVFLDALGFFFSFFSFPSRACPYTSRYVPLLSVSASSAPARRRLPDLSRGDWIRAASGKGTCIKSSSGRKCVPRKKKPEVQKPSSDVEKPRSCLIVLLLFLFFSRDALVCDDFYPSIRLF